MMFITGPLYSGKRTFARQFAGSCITDVQDKAADAADLTQLAEELAQYDIVIATEVGGGVVPVDAGQRAAREAAGRLACLLAARADSRGADVLRHPHGAERRIAEKMLIYLLRHGLTEYNAQKRYQGQRDIPLSPEGAAQLRKADFDPDVVYVTPLQRTSQTAKIVFPHAKLVVVDGLKEMCFGSFEGRNFIEMEHDPDYQAWVQANCESSCPDGERKEDFSNRICAAFSKLVDEALAEGKDRLVILAHGGTQMAAMERYGVPHQDYYKWCGPNAGGYVLDAKDWTQKHILTVIKTVQYTKSAAEENP